jgi:type 2 lantibiotic biosynthesis protein LanM
MKKYLLSTFGNAVSLEEKAKIFHTKNMKWHINCNKSQEYWEKWCTQPPFMKNSYLKQRLNLLRLNESEFFQILGISGTEFAHHFVDLPQWVVKLNLAFSATKVYPRLSILKEADLRNLNIFLKIIEPIINAGCLELKKKIIALAKSAPKGNLPINLQNIVDILSAPIVDTLLRMTYRVFILELNVARLQNRLKGDNPEESFASFIRQYQQKDKSFGILKEYPILARKLITVIDNWISYSSEFVKHLLIDWKAICNIFSPYNNPGILAKVYSSGDTHGGGRSVLIAEFDSGFKIVYKPRSMSVDVHFQELLNWVNTHLDLDFFPITKVIDRKEYGWMEFIPYIPCNSSEEVRRFYERIGGYLAILYVLDATDFHFENLIANKEFPFLIDLESLFQPHIGVRKVEKSEYMAANFILNTVIRTGLLPQRVFVKSDYHGIDLGGVSPIAGQLVPDKMFVVKKAGTDEAMVIPIEAKTQKSYNQPSITNEPVNVLEYVTEIINGFSTVYQLILRYRGKLLQGGSPLMKFRGDEIRVLFRPTRTYSLLLSNSYHPDLLRNALDRDSFLDKLWLAVEENPYLKK